MITHNELRSIWKIVDDRVKANRSGRLLDIKLSDTFGVWKSSAWVRIEENGVLRDWAWKAHQMFWGRLDRRK